MGPTHPPYVMTHPPYVMTRTKDLRLPNRYAVKTDPPCTFPSIILLRDHLSKIWGLTFWPSGQGCQWCVYIFKVTSRGKAEIKNGPICCFLGTFNFSSATRGHLENVKTLLTSLATWSKSCPSVFWKMVYITKSLREICKWGSDFWFILQHTYEVTGVRMGFGHKVWKARNAMLGGRCTRSVKGRV